MAFQEIPNVSLSGGTYGGFIYSVNYKNNYDASPSEVTINIVNDSGIYNPRPKIFSKATIQIGDINFRGELKNWEISEEVGRKILSLTFIDESIILDRIWVSLFKRHKGKGGTKFVKTKTIEEENIVPVFKTIKGDNNNFYYILYIKEKVSVEIRRNLRRASVSNFNENGGEIIIGEEQYVENSCSIPNVLYSFGDLLSLSNSLVTAPSLINTNYKNSYTGSLRQVLQNWCADFGYSFYWDLTSNKAVIFDLKIPKQIPSENNFTSSSILRKRYGQSSEGTFAQYGVAWYEKEGLERRKTEISSTRYVPTYYYPFGLSFVYYQGKIFDLQGDPAPGVDLRTQSEFITSAMLQYYYSPFRKYYLWYDLGIINGNNPGKGATPLGIKSAYKINDPSIINTLINNFSNNNGTQTSALFLSQKLSTFGANNLEFYIAYYDPSIEENFQNYEQEIISNYIGKYYRGPTQNFGSNVTCNKKFFYKNEFSETPGGQTYSYNRGNPPPFSKLVRSSDQLANADSDRNSIIKKGAQYNIFQRDGSFSHSQDEFFSELGLYDNEINLIDQYLPMKLKIDGPVLAVFTQLAQQNLLGEINISQLENFYFFMAIKKEKIVEDLGLTILPSSTKIPNRREQIAQIQTSSDDFACNFESVCQTEDAAIQKAIEQRRGDLGLDDKQQNIPPPEGLFSPATGYGVNINFQGNEVTVVSPSDSPYQGYQTITTTVQVIENEDETNTDGKIKITKIGNINNAENCSQIRVIENNFTSEESDSNSINSIEAAARAFSDGQTVTNSNPRQFLSVTSTEFLNNFTQNDGLESIETVINDSGVEITYNFASAPPAIPSPDVILARVENRKNRNSPR